MQHFLPQRKSLVSECKGSQWNAKVLQANAKFNGQTQQVFLSISWFNAILLENTNVLQTNAKFLGRIQSLLSVNTNFLKERKSFANERKVSQGTLKFCEQMQSLLRRAKVLRENSTFLGEDSEHKVSHVRMQSFSGNPKVFA